MNIIDRYLGKRILLSIFTVLFMVTGIEMFILFIAELRDIGHNHYTVSSAFIYILLNLPDQIYQLFPMAGLLGMLMAFGLLASHSELVILQSIGLSPLKITFSALKTIIVLLILMSIVGETLAPKASEIANNYKNKQLESQQQTTALAYDLWLHIKNDYLHINEMASQNELKGLSWYHFDTQGNLLQSNVADQAIYQNGQWTAMNVKQTNLSSQAITLNTSANMIWPFVMTPVMLLNSTQNPSDLSLNELHRSLEFHKHIHAENEALQLAFWRRLMQPAASLVMMLLAIPFIFGPLRQASHSLRLVVGIAAGFAFYYLNQFFGPLVLLFHWSPLIGAIIPTIVFGALGIILLRMKRH